MQNTEYHPITNSTAYAITNACHIVHDWAKKKGWWDEPRNKGELIALMHSELSEALEYLRAKEQPAMDDKLPDVPGEHAELADVVIRILDYAGAFGIDLGEVIRRKHEFNIMRPVKHGKVF